MDSEVTVSDHLMACACEGDKLMPQVMQYLWMLTISMFVPILVNAWGLPIMHLQPAARAAGDAAVRRPRDLE